MTSPKSRTDLRTCPVCKCELRSGKYDQHVARVHNVTSPKTGETKRVPRKGKRAELRKQELRRRNRIRYVSIATCMVIIVLAGTVIYLTSRDNSPGLAPAQPTPAQQLPAQVATTVKIPVTEMSTSALFYTYDSDGTVVRYFAAIGSDGSVHMALDACDVCYAEKKGYRQVGDVMKCNNCGKEFAINSVGTENLAGGCWPSYLPLTISGADAVVEISDIQAKTFMFQ